MGFEEVFRFFLKLHVGYFRDLGKKHTEGTTT